MRIVNDLEREAYTTALPDVQPILEAVKKEGDAAVRRFTAAYDSVSLSSLRVGRDEIRKAYEQVDGSVVELILSAIAGIEKLSRKQMEQLKSFEVEISPGAVVRQTTVPLRRVGIYVPGGNAPLPSTVLMAAVPARIAGVRELVLCSPPTCQESINPVTLVAADQCGVKEIYRIGGAQAIAAMAYGTESVQKVDKIVGPGNRYVTAAKKAVFGDVGIDFLAGPSEIVIIADERADAACVAADLLAEAEHDEDAMAVLITTSKQLAEEVADAVEQQLEQLKNADVARTSVEENGKIIVAENIEEAIALANAFAPEHVSLQVANPDEVAGKLQNYGVLFVGRYTPNVLGDYVLGSNHILPTGGTARFASGLSVHDFTRRQTCQRVSKAGYAPLGRRAAAFAELEGLEAHKKAAEIRLEELP